jgi:hypothetical protein
VDLNKLSLGDKIVGGTGIVLFLLLLIVPWHSQTVDLGQFGGKHTYTLKATSGDGGAVGWPAILAILLLIAIVAVVLVRKLTTADLPELPIPWNQAIFYATIAVPVLLVLKLLLKNESISFWAYIDILIAIGMAYGGFLIFKESDEATATGSAPPTPI